jgi:predicted Zn finger-like uncharacterized protein
MRLICPNCDAQYEVPDNVIPEAGRDVQCSDCGNTWFQGPASAMPAPDETPFERQPIPPEVSEILHEEAEIERQARANEFAELVPEDGDEADIAPPPFEDIEDDEDVEVARDDEPDLTSNPFAVDPDPEEPEETDAERRARETRARMARMRGIEENNPFTAARDSRKGALPDVDAINSSLSPDPKAASKPAIDLEDLNRKKRRGSGFRTGFTVMVFLGLLLMAIYMSHENLGRVLPFADPALDMFADYADQWRFWVEDEAAKLLIRLSNFVDETLNG